MTSATSLRDQLIDAGRAELVERGHAGVSLRAVARRVDVSHAAPGYHFGDRAGLLTAVAAAGFRELAAAMDGVASDAEASPGDRLARLGLRYVDFVRDNPALYDLMFRPSELRPGDEELRSASVASLRALTEATSAPSGEDRGEPTDLTVISWAFAHGIACLAMQGAIDAMPLADGRHADVGELVRAFATAVTRQG